MVFTIEALRPQDGASRARSGKRDASKRNTVLIVPLDPAYKAGLAGHLPVKLGDKGVFRSLTMVKKGLFVY